VLEEGWISVYAERPVSFIFMRISHKEFFMKRFRIFLAVIAMVALAGSLILACNSDSGSGGGGGGSDGGSTINGWQGGKKTGGGGGGNPFGPPPGSTPDQTPTDATGATGATGATDATVPTGPVLPVMTLTSSEIIILDNNVKTTATLTWTVSDLGSDTLSWSYDTTNLTLSPTVPTSGELAAGTGTVTVSIKGGVTITADDQFTISLQCSNTAVADEDCTLLVFANMPNGTLTVPTFTAGPPTYYTNDAFVAVPNSKKAFDYFDDNPFLITFTYDGDDYYLPPTVFTLSTSSSSQVPLSGGFFGTTPGTVTVYFCLGDPASGGLASDAFIYTLADDGVISGGFYAYDSTADENDPTAGIDTKLFEAINPLPDFDPLVFDAIWKNPRIEPRTIITSSTPEYGSVPGNVGKGLERVAGTIKPDYTEAGAAGDGTIKVAGADSGSNAFDGTDGADAALVSGGDYDFTFTYEGVSTTAYGPFTVYKLDTPNNLVVTDPGNVKFTIPGTPANTGDEFEEYILPKIQNGDYSFIVVNWDDNNGGTTAPDSGYFHAFELSDFSVDDTDGGWVATKDIVVTVASIGGVTLASSTPNTDDTFTIKLE